MLARWVADAMNADEVASNDGPKPMFSARAVHPGAAAPTVPARLAVWYSELLLAIACECC